MQDQQGKRIPHRPSLQIAITDKQYRALQDYIPYGYKSTIFSKIIDDLIRAIEVNPQLVVAGLITGNIKLQDFSGPVNEALKDKQDGEHIHSSKPRLHRHASQGSAKPRLYDSEEPFEEQGEAEEGR